MRALLRRCSLMVLLGLFVGGVAWAQQSVSSATEPPALKRGASFAAECTSDDKPFWDGDFATDKQEHTGSFVLETRQGFWRISLLEKHNHNIALLDVRHPDGAPIDGLSKSEKKVGPLRDGWTTISYDTTRASLERVKVIVTPLRQGHSRFMFQASDECEHTLQADPQVTLAPPTHYALEGSYPNPFRGETTIRFKVPEPTEGRLVIYDLLGRRAKVLAAGQLDAGVHEVVWKGTDESGRQIASGVYVYQLQAGSFRATRTVTKL